MAESAFELLGGALPKRERPGRDAFPTTGKAVKQWIEALPMANSGATARLLYNGLKELNQLEVEPNQRIEILEQMRHPVGVVISSMERHVLGQPLPLPLQKRQIGAVMRDFHRELAIGFATCVYDYCAPKGNVPFLRGRSTALALVRAMRHCSQMLSKCYIAYSEIPAGVWGLLHRLAGFAFEAQLSDKGMTDPQVVGITLTPESIYVQTLLTFIGNPYRLTQKEIVDVETAAKIWSSHCRIHLTGTSGSFVIDPRSDSPPMSPRAEINGTYWRLETNALVQSLQNQLRLLPMMDAPIAVRGRLGHGPEISGDVAEKLIVAWSFSGERSHPRLPAEHNMDTCIGLHAVHYLAAQEQDFKDFVGELGGGVNLSDRDRSAAWAQANLESAIPSLLRVRVIDQSLGGYRLFWDNAEGLKAKVGELIALSAPAEDDDDAPDWMVGVLRWLKGGNNDSLEAGVQLLSRRVEAVAVRATSEAQTSRVILRGLLLAPLAIDGSQQPTLLAPSILDSTGGLELLRLPDPNGMDERELTEPLESLDLLENSGAYKQFRYGRRSSQESTLAAPEAPPSAELDEIWSTV
jgi:cyclic-di-GMP-binding protein